MQALVEAFLPLFVAIATILVLLTVIFAPTLIAWIGTGASKAIGNVASLFPAAISVALIRAGVAGILGHAT